MTRLSHELPNGYPRKYVWWMECDVCQTTISDPQWTVDRLPLDDFRADGWECNRISDICPDCLRRPVVPVPEGETKP